MGLPVTIRLSKDKGKAATQGRSMQVVERRDLEFVGVDDLGAERKQTITQYKVRSESLDRDIRRVTYYLYDTWLKQELKVINSEVSADGVFTTLSAST